MTKLLQAGDILIKRPPRRPRVRQTASVALPSPTAPKELFVAIRKMASADFLTANLSRAVVQNVRESEVQERQHELFGCVDDEIAWEVAAPIDEPRSDVSPVKLLISRLESILRDAEYQGKLGDVIDSFGKMVAEKAGKEETTIASFLDQARRLDQLGQTDTALDIIFDQIDEMLLAGEFDRMNQLLIDTDTERYSVDLLLGILTATLPAKGLLPGRAELFPRVEQTLQSRGELKEGLLVGLD
jgi:hypothetical protein